MLPLVTCLCLTRDRREWLPKAIACFLRQTYEPRELLIVATGSHPVRDLIPADERIKLLSIGWSGLPVGSLRNLGCDAAAGSIIANWDDDDHSEPGRLAHQVERLQAGYSMTGFHSMKFTDGRAWWQYTGASSYCLGTSLCYWREWWKSHPFADLQTGQDEQLSMIAASRKQLVADPDLDLMYASIHPGNTSPRQVNASNNWSALPGFEWRAA